MLNGSALLAAEGTTVVLLTLVETSEVAREALKDEIGAELPGMGGGVTGLLALTEAGVELPGMDDEATGAVTFAEVAMVGAAPLVRAGVLPGSGSTEVPFATDGDGPSRDNEVLKTGSELGTPVMTGAELIPGALVVAGEDPRTELAPAEVAAADVFQNGADPDVAAVP